LWATIFSLSFKRNLMHSLTRLEDLWFCKLQTIATRLIEYLRLN
jgi:hypothetical protein